MNCHKALAIYITYIVVSSIYSITTDGNITVLVVIDQDSSLTKELYLIDLLALTIAVMDLFFVVPKKDSQNKRQ